MDFSRQPLLFDAPGTYRIRVRGRLAARWADNLGGMAISVTQRASNCPVTTLLGRLTDQAAVMGVLTTLYDMGFTLLDVKRLPDPTVPEVTDEHVDA